MKDLITVGFFPGAFKPPHKGHFLAVKKAATAIDGPLFVIVSPKSRYFNISEFSAKDSLAVWKIYKTKLPPNVHIVLANSSPVTTVYQTIEYLDKEDLTLHQKMEPTTIHILENISPAKKYKTTVFASTDDLERFDRLTPNNRVNLTIKNIPPFIYNGEKISASNLRRFISNKSVKEVESFIPPILKEQVLKIWIS